VFLAVVSRLPGQDVPVDPLASLTTADVANGSGFLKPNARRVVQRVHPLLLGFATDGSGPLAGPGDLRGGHSSGRGSREA
jgi:hypothetical protein